MIKMSYYKNFSIIIGNPLWRHYLRWRYRKSIKDFEKLNFQPNFSKEYFTCLLCGAGNEVTAEEFIKFVLASNGKANIWIIDLGREQVEAVKKMVKTRFPKLNIKINQINALKLGSLIKSHSVDWIETDGLFEFLDNDSIVELLKVWANLLTKSGFATTTATSSRWKLQEYFDLLKIWVGKNWLGVKVFPHKRSEMRNNFVKAGFNYTEGPTIIPYFKRYSLITKR
jgi:hypothetical protein